MIKFKHNKKRNTAFLFEILVRDLTVASLKSNESRKKTIINILKEFFAKNSILDEELKLYKNLTTSTNLKNDFAKKVLQETKKRHENLNKREIFQSQTKLIKEMNKKLGKDIFSHFVTDYKNLATTYQIFYENASVKEQIRLEEHILERIQKPVEKIEEQKYKPISKLAFKTFYDKFNETYDNSLLKEQKELIKLYVSSCETDDLEFKVFLNEEVSRLKEKLLNVTEAQNSSLISNKKKQIIEVLNSFSKKKIDKSTLEKILKIQQLTEEINKNGN